MPLISVRAEEAIRRLLRSRLGRPLSRLARIMEYVVFGGNLREDCLLKMLAWHYQSRFRRNWVWSTPPHFSDHQVIAFESFYGDHSRGPYKFYRGFYSSEIIRQGDRLLDIGCGDGFFTRRFFASKCKHVDAVDVDRDAIAAATRYNSACNVSYHLQDAVREPFPNPPYDVVVWDGAIGHFAAEVTGSVLAKISRALAPGGAFAGSESLGKEGDDHLQSFETIEDLGLVLSPHFAHVDLRTIDYGIGRWHEFERREAFWRCSNDPTRLETSRWTSVSRSGRKKPA